MAASHALQTAADHDMTDQEISQVVRNFRAPSRVEMAQRIEARSPPAVDRPQRALVIINKAPEVPLGELVARLEQAEGVVLTSSEISTEIKRPVVPASVKKPVRKISKSALCQTAICKKRLLTVATAKKVRVRVLATASQPVFATKAAKSSYRYAETTADIIQRSLNFRG